MHGIGQFGISDSFRFAFIGMIRGQTPFRRRWPLGWTGTPTHPARRWTFENSDNFAGYRTLGFRTEARGLRLARTVSFFKRLGRYRRGRTRISVSEGEHHEFSVLVERSEIIHIEPPGRPEAAKSLQQSGA